ncbi:MAG: hypothetical protein GYB31_00205 [Bacteroidetes bacterium]|nr:hypothetical protein [Bacteroidota bacterium]
MRNLIYISLLFSGLLLSSCDHVTEPFDGPALVDRFGEFNLVQGLAINRSTVDFQAGEVVVFTAEFNKNVDWVIEIIGQESGAVKRIVGFDKELNTANATWRGGTTELPFFKEEMCSVELLIPEEETFSNTGEVEILTTKIYAGSLFTDFEEDQSSSIEFGNYEFELVPESGRTNSFQAAQGEYSYLLEGTDDVVPNFFVGLINVESTVTGETYAPLPTTVPEDLYFNCFIYSDGSPHGIAVIQFVFDTNDSGAFEDGPDATFQIEGDFPLTWEGWQHISHPMSEVGMTQSQLEKLVAIRVLLISDMNSQPNPPIPVDFAIDFITFTEGQALEL